MDWVTIIGYVIAPVTGVVTWFAASKKRKIETIDAAYDTWNKIVSSLRGQIDTLIEDNKKLKSKLEEMNTEIEQLRVEIKQNKHVNALKRKIERYEKLLRENNINF